MLSKLQQHEKLVLVVLVGLTLPAFGLPAAAFLGGGGGAQVALEIDGDTVSKDEYHNWKRRWLGPRRQLAGREGGYESKDLHAHIVLVREAKAAGVTVSDTELNQFVQAACTNPPWAQQNPTAMPFFPDKKGFYWQLLLPVFRQLAQASGQELTQDIKNVPWDESVFNNIVDRSFSLVNRAELLQSMREDLMVMKLRGLMDGGNYVSTLDAYEALAIKREEIAIEFAVAKAESFDKEVRATPPTDEELKKHYESHVKAFEIGEKRTCEMLVAEVDDLVKLISISDTEGRADYDRSRDAWRKSKGAKTDAQEKAVESGPYRADKKDDEKKDGAKDDGAKDDGAKDDDAKKDDAEKDDAEKDDAEKDDAEKDTATGGGGADLFEPQVGGAPAGEPKQDPPPANPEGDGANEGEGDGKQDGEGDKPDPDDVLPYADVQIQVRNQLRKERALTSADSVIAEVHRIYSDLENDIVTHDGDPLEEIASISRANKRIAMDPERFVPDATGYRLSYRKVTTFRTEADLRANNEGTEAAPKPIADFTLADDTSIARDVADLYTEIPMGRVSRILRTGTARALVRFLAQEAARTPEFKEVQDDVREHYYAKRAMEMARDAATKCQASVKSGETMQNAAKANKLDYGTSGWFMKGNRIPFLPSSVDTFAQSPFFDYPPGMESALVIPDTTRRQYLLATVFGRRKPKPSEIPEQGWAEQVPSMRAENRSRTDRRFSDPDTALARHEIKDFTEQR